MTFLVDSITAAFIRRIEDLEQRIQKLEQQPDHEVEQHVRDDIRQLIDELREHNQPIPAEWVKTGLIH